MEPRCDRRNGWERFIDSLDSSGGHIAVWLFIIVIGLEVMVWTSHPEIGVKIVEGAMLALATGLKFPRSNATRAAQLDSPPDPAPKE